MTDVLGALRRDIQAQTAHLMHSAVRDSRHKLTSTSRCDSSKKRCTGSDADGVLVDVKRVRENFGDVHVVREPPRFSVSSGSIALSKDEAFLAVVTCLPKCRLAVVDVASFMVVAQVPLLDPHHHHGKKKPDTSRASCSYRADNDDDERSLPLLVEKVQWVGRAFILIAYTSGRTLLVPTGLRDENQGGSESDDGDESVRDSEAAGDAVTTLHQQQALIIGQHLVDVDAFILNPMVVAVLAVEHTSTGVVFVSANASSKTMQVVERVDITGMVHVTHGCLAPGRAESLTAVLCCSGAISVYQVHREANGRAGGGTLLKTFLHGSSSVLVQGIVSNPASPTEVHCFFFERAHPTPPLPPTSGVLSVDGDNPMPLPFNEVDDDNEAVYATNNDLHLFHSVGPLNSVTGGATTIVPTSSLTIATRSIVDVANHSASKASGRSNDGSSDAYLGCVTLSTLVEFPGIDKNAAVTVRHSKWVGLPLSLRLVPLHHSVVLWGAETLVTVCLQGTELVVSKGIQCRDVLKAQVQAGQSQDTSSDNGDTQRWAGVAFLRELDQTLNCFSLMGTVTSVKNDTNSGLAAACPVPQGSSTGKTLFPLVILRKLSLVSWAWDYSIEETAASSDSDGHVTAVDVRRIVREEHNSLFNRIELLVNSVEERLVKRMESMRESTR